MVGPRAVTPSTLPPAVTNVPSGAPVASAVPAWKTVTPSTAAASPKPVMTSPVRGASGYPSDASTTQTAASGANLGTVMRAPDAASASRAARSPS